MGGVLTTGAFISPLGLCPKAARSISGSQRQMREKQAEGMMLPCLELIPNGDWLELLQPLVSFT